MVDSQIDPTTYIVYQNMKQELQKKGYEDFKYLGKGAQGLVLLAKKSDKRYAIKGVLIKFLNEMIDNASLQQVESEIKMLTTFKGFPYVLNLVVHLRGNSLNILFYPNVKNSLILYLPGTPSEIIEQTKDKKLNELSAIKYTKDIAEGLNCIVNDLKMDNILIDYNGNAVVSDFGYADKLPKMSGYGVNEFVSYLQFKIVQLLKFIQLNSFVMPRLVIFTSWHHNVMIQINLMSMLKNTKNQVQPLKLHQAKDYFNHATYQQMQSEACSLGRRINQLINQIDQSLRQSVRELFGMNKNQYQISISQQHRVYILYINESFLEQLKIINSLASLRLHQFITNTFF